MKYVFCLGGQDEEMKEIKKVALAQGHIVHDKGLGWGAKASAYTAELEKIATNNNRIPPVNPNVSMSNAQLEIDRNGLERIVTVLIELDIDCELPMHSVVIDHHGNMSGKQPALQQVLSLLNIEPTKKQDMIGAMDAGYIYGLIALGCSEGEIAEFLGQEDGLSIRQMLVNSCHLTDDQAAEADRDIAAAKIMPKGLIVVHRDRNTCAEICAKLYGRQKDQNILILSDWNDPETGEAKQEANFYSTGDRVKAVAAEFPQGWTGGAGLMSHTPEAKEFWCKYGGEAPDTAFFGMTGDYQQQLEEFVRNL